MPPFPLLFQAKTTLKNNNNRRQNFQPGENRPHIVFVSKMILSSIITSKKLRL